MHRHSKSFAVIAFVLGSFLQCFGQSQPDDYPKVLLIVSDAAERDGKAGLGDVLTRLKAHAPSKFQWIGGEVSVGKMQKTVAIFQLKSFSEISQVTQAIDTVAESFPESRRPEPESAVYELDRDASFDGSHIPWKEAKAFALNHVLLRRGTPDTYREQQVVAAKLLSQAKISDEVWIGYDLRFGGSSPSYLFISPMRSLADLDVDLSGRPRLFTPEQSNARVQALRLSVVSERHELVDVKSEFTSTR